MRRTVLTALLVPLMALLTVQAAAASGYHHARAKSRPAASEQLRNSNAYAAPDEIAGQSYWTNYANGEMASGPAGR
jgi:hypothetical protein